LQVLEKQMESLEGSSNNICDVVHDIQNINMCLQSSLQKVQNKLDTMDEIETVTNEEVRETIQTQLQQDEMEKEEKQKRCKNVIVFGLNESASKDATVRVAKEAKI